MMAGPLCPLEIELTTPPPAAAAALSGQTQHHALSLQYSSSSSSSSSSNGSYSSSKRRSHGRRNINNNNNTNHTDNHSPIATSHDHVDQHPQHPHHHHHHHPPPPLERHLTLLDLMAIGVGGTIGSGLFVLAGFVAHTYAGPATVLAWALSGGAALLSGACYAELASLVPPTSGGAYVYARHMLGEVPALWTAACLSLEYLVAASAVSRSWADKVMEYYLHTNRNSSNENHDNSSNTANTTTAAAATGVSFSPLALLISSVTVLLLLNGVKESKTVTNVFTALKVSLVLMMIVVGFTHITPTNWTPFVNPALGGYAGIVRGATGTFFGYLGYDQVTCLAGEAIAPHRNVPIAILGTILTVALLYMIATLALTGMVPYTDISPVSGFPSAFADVGLPVISHIAALGEIVTLPIVVLISLMAQPRLQYALAHDGLLPAWVGVVNQSGNLVQGTFVAGSLMIVIATFVPFTHLNDVISCAVLMALSMTDTSLILYWHATTANSHSNKNANAKSSSSHHYYPYNECDNHSVEDYDTNNNDNNKETWFDVMEEEEEQEDYRPCSQNSTHHRQYHHNRLRRRGSEEEEQNAAAPHHHHHRHDDFVSSSSSSPAPAPPSMAEYLMGAYHFGALLTSVALSSSSSSSSGEPPDNHDNNNNNSILVVLKSLMLMVGCVCMGLSIYGIAVHCPKQKPKLSFSQCTAPHANAKEQLPVPFENRPPDAADADASTTMIARQNVNRNADAANTVTSTSTVRSDAAGAADANENYHHRHENENNNENDNEADALYNIGSRTTITDHNHNHKHDSDSDSSTRNTTGVYTFQTWTPYIPCLGIFVNWYLIVQLDWLGVCGLVGVLVLTTLYYWLCIVRRRRNIQQQQPQQHRRSSSWMM